MRCGPARQQQIAPVEDERLLENACLLDRQAGWHRAERTLLPIARATRESERQCVSGRSRDRRAIASQLSETEQR